LFALVHIASFLNKMENFLNPEVIIRAFGYIGIFAIIFAESGIFFAFFLPGDTLLFTAGFLASQGYLNIALVMFLVFVASFTGLLVGYFIGKKIGEKIFYKKGSWLFDPKNLKRTRLFYEKYGDKTMVLSRFVPIIRTFAPLLAGVGNMNFRTFVKSSLLGSALWVLIVIPTGYFIGNKIPSIHEYVMPVVTILFTLTFLPIIWHFLKQGKKYFKK